MTTSKFETDRRSLIGGTLGALTIAAISGAAAAPASKTLSTIRKARPPRGSFGIVLPGNKRFDAVTEIVFDSDWAYEQEYLGGRTAYSEEAEHTMPALVIMSRQIGIRDFDPGKPIPAVKRFGVLRRKPELTTDTLALTWRNDHAPLFAANDYLRRYYINLTDRTYAPDVPWDGYADIWWDDFASTTLHSDARVPIPDSDASEVMYMFMTPRIVT